MADHFVDNMEDWSLQAVVRESTGDHFIKNIHDDDDQKLFMEFSSGNPHHDHYFISSFPEIFDGSMGSSDELEEMYKPFYPGLMHSVDDHAENDVFQEKRPENDHDKVLLAVESDRSSGSSSCAAVKVSHEVYTPKYKRRKNQQKRVIIQVSADCLGSDMWAWRKYGQKPIKGSPYPRSYYRCSSSKGCLARKQVEQSCTDPGMFIITYTAEHSHSQPTRRNSLAGTIRQKFPNPKSPNHLINIKQETNPNPDSFLQNVASSAGDEINRMKQEIDHQEEDRTFPVSGDDVYYNHEFSSMSDPTTFNDEFFSGLDFLDGFLSECHV